jgi:hypothetical protein
VGIPPWSRTRYVSTTRIESSARRCSAEIAEVVGKGEENCRQILARARRQVQAGRARCSRTCFET